MHLTLLSIQVHVRGKKKSFLTISNESENMKEINTDLSEKMILEFYIMLKFVSDASTSPVCRVGTYQQRAINGSCFPFSVLACYCGIAVLCCIAVFLVFFQNVLNVLWGHDKI